MKAVEAFFYTVLIFGIIAVVGTGMYVVVDSHNRGTVLKENGYNACIQRDNPIVCDAYWKHQ